MDVDFPQVSTSSCPINGHNSISNGKTSETLKCPVSAVPNVQENGDDEEDLNDILSDIEEMIENAVDLDVSKFPEGATVRKKRVLEFRMSDPFSILPNGWIEVTHNSGLPVYLHKASRVCTFSRPYFLGKMSVRRHNVPASSIPCFYTRKRQAQIKAQREQEQANRPINTPAVEVKQAGDEDHYLNDDQIYDYSKNLFKFKTIDVVRFKKWSETRQFQRGKKRKHGELINEFNSTERPGLPATTKLITIPALNENSKPNQRALSLNPIGKSSVALLHDFVQKVLKNTISYKFFELTSIAKPYRCDAYLKQVMDSTKIHLHQSVEAKLKVLRERYERENISSDVDNSNEDKTPDEAVLGIGFGKSKKSAKMAAAEKVLKILIPTLRFNEEHIVIGDNEDFDEDGEKKPTTDPGEMFDLLEITDSRIPDLCNRIAQPQPFVILKELVRRNLTMSDAKVDFQTGKFRHKRHEFILKVGEMEVKVREGNKHDGKQRAAQQMLAKLYPNAQNWNDILRLYNTESLSMQKDAQRYKRKLTSQATDDLSESFAVSSESIGLELRTAMKSMEEKYSTNKHRELVNRPPIGYTAPPLASDDLAHFSTLCQRYAHLFGDDNLLNSIIE